MKPSRNPFIRPAHLALAAMLGLGASAQAATFTWSGTTAGTYNWASPSTNWNATPVSNLDTILNYTSTLAAGVAIISNNDVASPPFKLNQLSFTNAGPASGTAPTITLTGNQLEFVTNSSSATPTLTFNTTGTIKPTIDIQNNLLLTNNLGVAATTDGKLSGVISGAGGLTKTGAGKLTLTGANTYTGTTTVNVGTLSLDFAAAGAPTTNIINNTANSSGLSLGGGTLSITGKNAGTTSQTFASTFLNSGASTITLIQNGSTSTTIDLAAITRNTGATLNFSAAPVVAGPLIAKATNTNNNNDNTNGIIGAWATSGNNWIQSNGSGSLRAFQGQSGVAETGWLNTGVQNLINTGATPYTLTNNRSLNTHNLTSTTASVALGNFNYTLNGLMASAASGSATISTSGTGKLVIGSTSELIIVGSTPAINISAPIANNGLNASSVTFSAAGTLTLSGANSYTGLTTVNSGIVSLGAANTLHSSSGIVVNGGTLALGDAHDQSVNSVKLTSGSITNGTTTPSKLTSATAFDLQAGSVAAILDGTLGVSKTTSGTVTLSGANIYTGGTTISAGYNQSRQRRGPRCQF